MWCAEDGLVAYALMVRLVALLLLFVLLFLYIASNIFYYNNSNLVRSRCVYVHKIWYSELKTILEKRLFYELGGRLLI